MKLRRPQGGMECTPRLQRLHDVEADRDMQSSCKLSMMGLRKASMLLI